MSRLRSDGNYICKKIFYKGGNFPMRPPIVSLCLYSGYRTQEESYV
jgi:hypothetical protein